MVEVNVHGRKTLMEVDTGASTSVMSEQDWRRISGRPGLERTHRRLVTYTGEVLPICGTAMVEVELNNQRATLPVTVIRGGGPALLGRD